MTAQREHGRIDRPATDRLPAIIESLLFVAEEPQEIGTLAKSLNVPRQGVEQAIETLAASVNGRGLLVQRLGDRVQLATAPDAAPYIEQFLEVEHGRLSRAALESLAVIAYRRPVTRAGVEAIRGVNSDHAVATLLARGLVEEVGRAPGPGRPVLSEKSATASSHATSPPSRMNGTCQNSRRSYPPASTNCLKSALVTSSSSMKKSGRVIERCSSPGRKTSKVAPTTRVMPSGRELFESRTKLPPRPPRTRTADSTVR